MELIELTDRLLITETLHRYCVHVDDSDLDALLGLFTPDAVIEMGNGSAFAGQRELRALLIDRIGRWTTTNHHCSTVTVPRYDGETATACSYIYAFHDAPERNQTMHLWGRYDDELTRASGRWQISRRRLLVAGIRQGTSQELPARFEHYPRIPYRLADGGAMASPSEWPARTKDQMDESPGVTKIWRLGPSLELFTRPSPGYVFGPTPPIMVRPCG